MENALKEQSIRDKTIGYIEIIAKTAGAISIVSLLTGFVLAIFFTDKLKTAYGIPFALYATTEDYLRITVSNIFSTTFFISWIIVTCVVVFKGYIFDHTRGNSIMKPIFMLVFTIFCLYSFHFSGHVWKSYAGANLSDRGRQGIDGLVNISTEEEQIRCLGFLAKAGEFSFFWSMETNNLVAISTSTITKQIYVVPAQPTYKVFRDFDIDSSEKSYKDSTYGRLVKAWKDNRETICPAKLN